MKKSKTIPNQPERNPSILSVLYPDVVIWLGVCNRVVSIRSYKASSSDQRPAWDSLSKEKYNNNVSQKLNKLCS